MKISKVVVEPLDIPLKESFEIALGRFDMAKNVLVKIVLQNGITGYGEASSSEFITGDNQNTLISIINYLKPLLLGKSIEEYIKILQELKRAVKFHPGAFMALESALLDAYTQTLEIPLYKFLGGVSSKIETDITLSISSLENMLKNVFYHLKRGFKIFKIKVGKNVKEDFEKVVRVGEEFPQIEIRIDANQGFTPKEAVKFINSLVEKGIKITLFEQPVHCKDLKGLKFVTENSPVPVAADESVFTPEDAFMVARERIVDVINIKLSKCGGILEALDIISIARASHLELMIGCMLESNVGLAGSVHLACGTGCFSYVDLDSPLLLKELPFKGGFELEGPFLTVKHIERGLGISPA